LGSKSSGGWKIRENTIDGLLKYLPKDEYVVEIKTTNCKIKKPTKGFYKLDIVITCIKTESKIFLEVKKQNDRGNAHERGYKYLPFGGIAQYIRGIIKADYYPVIVVFTGGMTSKSKYTNEIEMQYSNAEKAVFVYKGDPNTFISFVNEEILPRINRNKIDYEVPKAELLNV